MKNNLYKKILFSFGILMSLAVAHVRGQVAGNYSVSPSSGTYTAVSGGTSVSILTDDAISGAIPIGFTFTYAGTGYTNVYANSNGTLSFNSAATAEYTNNLSTGSNRPFVAPLWDDLTGSGAAARYLTSGTAPNRVFTMEWSNWRWDYNAASANISFQVKLYETTNNIQFIYNNLGGSLSSPSASVGLAGSSSGDFISLSSLGTLPSVSSGTETTSISAAPTSGQTYTFAPTGCFVPTNLAVSSITATTATVSWTNASGATSTEYKVVNVGAGTSGTAVATGTVSGGGTSAAVTGLSGGTSYDVYVRSVCSGGVFSAWSSLSNFTTTAVPRANDACSGATGVTIYSSSALGQASAAAVQAGFIDEGIAAPICNANTTKYDVWYSFTTPSMMTNRIVLTTAPGTETDWIMVLYGNSCGSLTQIQCSDDQNGLMPEIETCGLSPNTTYYVRLYPLPSNQAATCTFWAYTGGACSAAPSNDICGSATALTSSATSGTTVGATINNSISNSNCDQFGTANDAWYTFSAGTGSTRLVNANITVSSVQSGATVKFALYQGSCGSLFETFNANCGTATNAASATINAYGLEEGQTYYVRVWSNTAAVSGTFSIALSSSTALNALQLGDAATATSCQNLTDVVVNASNLNRWIPVMDGAKIVAELNPNGNALGTVSGSYFRNTDAIRSVSSSYFLDRNIAFVATSAPTSNVLIRFYYSATELAAFQAAAVGEPNGVTRYAGTGCVIAPPTSGGTNLTGSRGTAAFGGNSYFEFTTNSFSDFFVGPNVVTLPVELQKFDVYTGGGANLLTWTTVSEKNTRHFDIEQSSDGQTNWQKIGTVKATGNSNQVQNYRFEDPTPTCLRYYRLKMVDEDQKSETSPTRVGKRTPCATAVRLQPNPARAQTDLVVNIDNDESAKLTVTDPLGRVVWQQNLNLTSGENRLPIDVSNWANGTYFVQIQANYQIFTQKMVKN